MQQVCLANIHSDMDLQCCIMINIDRINHLSLWQDKIFHREQRNSVTDIIQLFQMSQGKIRYITRRSISINARLTAVIVTNTQLIFQRNRQKCREEFITYLASFISICWRISWRSWSLLAGKIFLSSNSCLLGLFRSLTASNSFLSLRGSVPATIYKHTVTHSKI